MKIEIKNIEYFLPKKLITNEDLERENPDWDMFKTGEKTGVYSRHFAEEDETAFDLSVKACEKLFSSGDIKVEDIGGIIYCTQSPDYIMPSNAFLVHKHFNFSHKTLAFDINLACSGYPYGLVLASSLIESNVAK